MPSPSQSHLVLIPSYNTGMCVLETVRQARQHWNPVWVVVDGSDDGSTTGLLKVQQTDPGFRVFVLPRNVGKGAALFYGLRQAINQGFSHVLTMDADGQHDVTSLPDFIRLSQQTPEAMILGKPIFDATAPGVRVQGRKICNWFVNLETLWSGIGDSLFGLRVYPALPLAKIMNSHRWMRRFDFDSEAVVRMTWAGVPAQNIDTPVRYFLPGEGGISHFRYVRDNVMLIWMHIRLLAEFLVRLPLVFWRRFRIRR
ncbi:MAG: glycosyltransferase family 2 protein [Burkholderiales bacterium]|jgi:glycosyltransferase involved in cell wall biosynthesis